VALSEDDLLYAIAGPVAAALLGLGLTPLREVTPASNLAFAFMALTIVAAELGGGTAAVVTAVASALSLDLFLTKPYLHLAIEDKHDVVAFAGLAVCGLIAAALAAQRSRRLAALTVVARRHEPLQRMLRGWEPDAPLDPQLARTLQAIVKAFPLAGAALRDGHDKVLAAAHPADGLRAVPRQVLDRASLLPLDEPRGARVPWELALPADGARVAVRQRAGEAGWLDLWGSGEPADAGARRALADVAALLELLLAARMAPDDGGIYHGRVQARGARPVAGGAGAVSAEREP
jgi:hypothetical protein